MKTIYGHFDDKQFENYKVRLHKELFWLLLYKDPKTKDEFNNIDFEKYFINLMKRIDGLNTLLLVISLTLMVYVEMQLLLQLKTSRRNIILLLMGRRVKILLLSLTLL